MKKEIKGVYHDGKETNVCRWILIDLDGVNFSNETLSANVTECSTHDAQTEREEGHVTEVEDRLKHSVHSETTNQNELLVRRRNAHFVLKKK